jgi:hypothetical protein
MKSFQVVTLILALTSLSAQAVFDPSWERPIKRADLVEVHLGKPVVFESEYELTLNRRDGGMQMPTSLTFTVIDMAGNRTSTQYPIIQITKNSCNDEIFFGAVAKPWGHSSIVLTDHSKSICDRVYPAFWEVEVTNSSSTSVGNKTYYQGNPEPVITIQ